MNSYMDTLAEWLRRRPAKPMGSPRVGSNPTGVDSVCIWKFARKKGLRVRNSPICTLSQNGYGADKAKQNFPKLLRNSQTSHKYKYDKLFLWSTYCICASRISQICNWMQYVFMWFGNLQECTCLTKFRRNENRDYQHWFRHRIHDDPMKCKASQTCIGYPASSIWCRMLPEMIKISCQTSKQQPKSNHRPFSAENCEAISKLFRWETNPCSNEIICCMHLHIHLQTQTISQQQMV